MKQNLFSLMQFFDKQIFDDCVVESFKMSEPNISIAQDFKSVLESDIDAGYLNIIVDLTNCKSLNPAIIGVMVVTLKKLNKLGGTIKIIKPGLFNQSVLNFTGTIEIFERYESLNKAIDSFNSNNSKSQDTDSKSLNDLALAS